MTLGIRLVGGDSELFQKYLERDDPCFGKSFAASAPECKACICPVVLEDGTLTLLREACRAVCKDTGAGALRRLSSRQVEDAFKEGKSVYEIWLIILNGCDPDAVGAEARTLLYDRCYYLENNRGLPPVTVPHTAELVEQWKSSLP